MKKKRVISVIIVLIVCCVILICFFKNSENKINEKNMQQDTYANEVQKNDEKIEKNGSDSGETDISDKTTDMQEKGDFVQTEQSSQQNIDNEVQIPEYWNE